MKIFKVTFLALVLVILWGCLGNNQNPYYMSPQPGPNGNPPTITPTSFNGIVVVNIPEEAATLGSAAFGSNPMTINAGTTVMWVNSDTMNHSVTADDESFDSGPIEPKSKFAMTFSIPRTYTYHCSIHPSMTGSIVVIGNAGYTPRF